jgi:mono/diheme cytochrome c family protein
MRMELNRSISKVSELYSLLLTIFLLSIIGLIPGVKASAQDSPEIPLSGKDLFIKNRCVNCHTIGRGRFVGPDLAGVGSRYSKEEIERWMENPQEIYQTKGKMPLNEGYPPMPPLGVSPGEAGVIADYILSAKTPAVSKTEGGSIKGRVVNASGEGVRDEIELTLTAYLGDRATGEVKVKTTSNGSFDFNDLAWDRSYTISLNYKGTEYATDKLVFSPEEKKKKLDLPIYEPTESDKDITVNADHLIVQISREEIAVAEIMVLHNGSKEIYVGKAGQNGTRETLRFDLPEGASNVQFLDGLATESVIQTTRGFIDTSSFTPGIRRVVYAYVLPYKSRKNVIEKRVNYPTRGFILLVSHSGANINVEGLDGGNTVTIDGEPFLRWSGENFNAGTTIRVKIAKPFLKGEWVKLATLGIVLLLLGGGVLYSLIAKKRVKPMKENNGYPVETEQLEKERNKLIREIAELDDRFQAEEMPEEEYRELRSKSKAKLIEITRRIKKN